VCRSLETAAVSKTSVSNLNQVERKLWTKREQLSMFGQMFPTCFFGYFRQTETLVFFSINKPGCFRKPGIAVACSHVLLAVHLMFVVGQFIFSFNWPMPTGRDVVSHTTSAYANLNNCHVRQFFKAIYRKFSSYTQAVILCRRDSFLSSQ